MPKPFRGLVAVAEFGSIFEADAAAQALIGYGIEATTSYDPAINSVAPYFASDRVVEVVVREEDVERARQVLDADQGALPPEFTSPDVLAWSAARTQGSAGTTSRWLGMRLLLTIAVAAIAFSALLVVLR